MKYLFLLNVPIKILIMVVTIISAFYIGYNVTESGYDFMFLLPLTYGVVFVLFISPILFKKPNMYVFVFSVISFLRYIVLPCLIVYSGWYGGRSSVPPFPSSYDLALKLMVYELIVISVVIYAIFKKNNIKETQKVKEEKEIKLPGNYFVYIVFVIFSLLLLAINPVALKSFAFVVPSESMRDFGTGSLLTTLTTYCLITSKYIVFLLLMSFIYRKYAVNKSLLYIWLSFLVVLINISIIFGDNRSDFIITAIVSILVFYKLYPRKSKLPIITALIVIVFITGFITSHRNIATSTGGADPSIDITDTLQVYIGGPYNVAIATEVADINSEARNAGNLIYDLLRPAMGINLLLKNVEGFEFSNYLFNQRIYFSDHTAQIIPMIGQGYFYFGFIFSPLLLVGFVYFVRFLVDVVRKQNRLELIFFLSIPITRIGFAMGQNAGILINDTTFFLFLNLTVFYLNNKIVLVKDKNKTLINEERALNEKDQFLLRQDL